jgi:hypothetical protein
MISIPLPCQRKISSDDDGDTFDSLAAEAWIILSPTDEDPKKLVKFRVWPKTPMVARL